VNLNIVVSFYHRIAVKRCLEDDEIERQLKSKIYDMGLCFLWFLGASMSITQRQDSVT
jgi:hypothetical protein